MQLISERRVPNEDVSICGREGQIEASEMLRLFTSIGYLDAIHKENSFPLGINKKGCLIEFRPVDRYVGEIARDVVRCCAKAFSMLVTARFPIPNTLLDVNRD